MRGEPLANMIDEEVFLSPVESPRILRLAALLAAGACVGVALALLVVNEQNSGPDTAFGQPRVELRSQLRMPHSPDAIWTTLQATRVRNDPAKGLYVASFPRAVSALAGQTLSVSGFMLPLEAKGTTTHFLLSKYTPVCFFCPPGQPNEIIEVQSSSAVVPSQDLVTVTGRFGLQKNGDGGLFFRLEQATLDD